MRTSARLAVACAAALAILVPAIPASAYVTEGSSWSGRPATITYWNGTAYRGELRDAVRAWNTSGVRVRFVPASRSRARLRIVYARGPRSYFGGAEGYASIGRQGTNTVQLSRGASGEVLTLVIAHELGHVLGLGHEVRRCATMNPIVVERCGRVPPCTILQADDVRGAQARYGGRPRRRPRAFCPDVPSGVRVEPATEAYGMQLVVKASDREGAIVARIGEDRCPKRITDGRAAATGTAIRARLDGGTFTQAIGPFSDPATWSGRRYCVSVWLVDSRGRRSPRPVSRRYVAQAGVLPAPTALVVKPSNFLAALTWNPVRHRALQSYEVASAPGEVCPASPDASEQRSAARGDSEAALVSVPTRGRWCFAVWARDEYGHRSAPAIVRADIPGNRTPIAGFTPDAFPGIAGTPVAFTDASTDPEGAITARRWDFGDPDSGAANTSTATSPTHTYATPGFYTVTLSVVDDGGLTSDVAAEVEIVAPTPP